MKKTELKALIKEIIKNVINEIDSSSNETPVHTSKGTFTLFKQDEEDYHEPGKFYTVWRVKDASGKKYGVPGATFRPHGTPEQNVEDVKNWIERGMQGRTLVLKETKKTY